MIARCKLQPCRFSDQCLCVAQHCGDDAGNIPIGGSAAWTQHPGTFAITEHDGQPCTFYEARLLPGQHQICCSSCWASGAFFSHFSHPLSVSEDDTVGTAGPLRCTAVTSPTPDHECFFGVQPSTSLWSDRDYAWVDGPSDILDGAWSYVQVPLEGSAGAPCPHEGGFRGEVREDVVVAICCANHCGGERNIPTGAGVWTEHPGAYTITGHGGAPCTFFEMRAPPGELEVCCSNCWSSGAFFAVADRVGSLAGRGPVPCSDVASAGQANCIEHVGTGEEPERLWSDRDYAWVEGPTDILDGQWSYMQVPLETAAGAPCPQEGGFDGTIGVSASIAICCANHCGRENTPRVTGNAAAVDWMQHPGSFSITGHGGTVCVLMESAPN
eukprot:SAG31_NODE_103_length_25164_cov_12.124317_17_plen_384_part_00